MARILIGVAVFGFRPIFFYRRAAAGNTTYRRLRYLLVAAWCKALTVGLVVFSFWKVPHRRLLCATTVSWDKANSQTWKIFILFPFLFFIIYKHICLLLSSFVNTLTTLGNLKIYIHKHIWILYMVITLNSNLYSTSQKSGLLASRFFTECIKTT